jgi:hypothetical protein
VLESPIQTFLPPEDDNLWSNRSTLSPQIRPGMEQLPTQSLSFDRLGVVRGVELGRLTFFPVLPSISSEKEVKLTRNLEAVLMFNAQQPEPLVLAPNQESSPYAAAIELAVINPEHLGYRAEKDLPASLNVDTVMIDQLPAAFIEVSQPGLTVITYAGLSAAGLPIETWNPAQLRLEQGGVPVAFEWEGDDDAEFSPDERILFYAEPRQSRYANYDVYSLHIEGQPGPRMGSRPAAPPDIPVSTAWVLSLAEENRIYTPECYCAPIPPGRDGERWVWDALHRPAHPQASYPIYLLAPGSERTSYLTLWLIGYTDLSANPDHRVDVSFNGHVLGQLEWNGKQAVQAEFELPPGLVVDGENLLSIQLPGLPFVPVEGVWLDAFQVRHPRGTQSQGSSLLFLGESNGGVHQVWLEEVAGLRVYDLGSPAEPVRLLEMEVTAEGRVSFAGKIAAQLNLYWVGGEAGLLEPDRIRPASVFPAESKGADYLAVGPEAFLPALDDLFDLRQEQGMVVSKAALEGIYDVYGEGRPDPVAIHRFLKFAYENWNPRPLYVLLLGDGSSDPRRYLETSPPTFLPPFLVDADPWSGKLLPTTAMLLSMAMICFLMF